MKRNGTLSLSLSRSRPHQKIVLLGVFALCMCVGIIAGTYLKKYVEDADAASSNITVTNNNQILTIDQSTPTITRTSTVTIKDPTATYGYTLSARITTNSIPNSTVKIGSASSTACTLASPCTITTSSTPTTILETTGAIASPNNATTASGDTTDWTVTITLPSATPLGNYLLDITYSEDPIIPLPAMQDFTTAQCSALALGTTIQLRDNRDDKVYRIRKMADSRCWMIDNLAFQLLRNDTGTTPNTGAPTYSPAAQVDTTPAGTPNLTSVDTVAQYIKNNNVAGQGQIPNNGNSTPSYLYNYCAAMGDTSTNCATTRAYTAGQPATPQTGICPAPFRLPIVGATPSPSIPGDGTNQPTAVTTTTNEFAKLDIWMGGTGTNRVGANTYPNFTTDNTTNSYFFFSSTFSGYYYSGAMGGQGSVISQWSSTANSGAFGYYLDIGGASTVVRPSYSNYKHYGLAVRCIL